MAYTFIINSWDLMSLDSLKVFWRKVGIFPSCSNYYLVFLRRKETCVQAAGVTSLICWFQA